MSCGAVEVMTCAWPTDPPRTKTKVTTVQTHDVDRTNIRSLLERVGAAVRARPRRSIRRHRRPCGRDAPDPCDRVLREPMSVEGEQSLPARVIDGDPRAVARAISLVEEGAPAGVRVVRALFERTGRAWLVGVTGPPGAGKSTLVNGLTAECRRAGRRVGVVAVDPTSPFSGGAVLGDRVRMQAHAGDGDVFIRSMATRGHLGGLARATREAALILDAAGYEVVFIETVGVGQDEVDVAQAADVSVVVLAPGFGDDVQAIKAGIFEIADVFVVNKRDREGADRAASQLEAMQSLSSPPPGAWRPPVIQTQATTGDGVADLLAALERFRAWGDETRSERRCRREDAEIRRLVGEGCWSYIARAVLRPGELADLSARVARREADPYSAAEAIVERALGLRGDAPGRR